MAKRTSRVDQGNANTGLIGRGNGPLIFVL
jgi:hypothetical protein